MVPSKMTHEIGSPGVPIGAVFYGATNGLVIPASDKFCEYSFDNHVGRLGVDVCMMLGQHFDVFATSRTYRHRSKFFRLCVAIKYWRESGKIGGDM